MNTPTPHNPAVLCPACNHPWLLHADPILPCDGGGGKCRCMAAIPEPGGERKTKEPTP